MNPEESKGEVGPSAEELVGPDLIARLELNGDLAGREPKYAGAEWSGKEILGSPLVDIAATNELAREAVDMCELILRLTAFIIRLLSKSPLLANVIAQELSRRFPDQETGAKRRVIFGLSIGTLNDKVAAAIEPHVPSPMKRLEALHWLQENGFRTFGMACPILPQRDKAAYKMYAEQLMQAMRAERCEAIWAEAVNFRAGGKQTTSGEQRQRDSFSATHSALVQAGCTSEAELFDNVARDPDAWELYCRSLFEALAAAAPPGKLRFLQYPRNFASIQDYWDAQQSRGAILLGGAVTKYRQRPQSKLDPTTP